MIKLKRLLLIHWQAYDFQLVEFEAITLITGQTGVGKSTIIDALNIILLGEKQKHIFNKAANENSNRTLESYLYGKLGDDGGDGFFYLREENFTSYIVAEFENEATSEFFCCGFVADCNADHSQPNSQWFTINAGLPEDFFLNQEAKIPYSISELTYQNNNKSEDEKVVLIATDKDYRKKIAGLFGQIRDDYRRLLKQSVSFTPVKDIEMFLTDFVSETQTPVNVEAMQKSIRRYHDLEQESNRIKSKVDKLKTINHELAKLEKRRMTELRQTYFIEKATLDAYHEQESVYHIQAEGYQVLIAENHQSCMAAKKRIDKLTIDKEALRDQRDLLVVLKDSAHLRQQIRHVREQEKGLADKTSTGLEIVNYMRGFMAEVKRLPITISSIIDLIQIFEKYEAEQVLISKFVVVNDLLGQIVKVLADYEYAVSEQKRTIRANLAFLLKEQEKLRKGIKIVPEQIRVFKEGLQSELRCHDKSASVDYLADVLEFKVGEESFQKSVEAYLGSQRYYLVIDPKDYNKALSYYQTLQNKGEVYGIGMINLQKLQKKQFKAEKNSLADKLTVKNPLVKPYINYLLGRVIACDGVENLANYATAITKDGFLYKGFVTRKLQFNQLTMSIGSAAVDSQVREVKENIRQCQAELNSVQQKITILDRLPDYQKKEDYLCELVTLYADRVQLTQKSAELAELTDKLNRLDDSELVALDKTIKELEQEISHLTVQMAQEQTQSKDAQVLLDKINQKLIPQSIKLAIEQEKLLNNSFATCPHLESFEVAYSMAINRLDELVYQNFITSYRKSLNQKRIEITKSEEQIRELMFGYNQTFTENLPINLAQANMYQEEYEKFMTSDLPKFEVDITDAKEKAIYEFRYEFLGKLKSNIENLYRQVEEINAALKQRKFGEDTYRFKIAAAREYKAYHDMIMDEMLMDQGEWNLLSAAFESKYAQQIGMLFDILSGEGLHEGESREISIRKFSDYKTYLTFDMLVTKGDSVQRLSKTYTQKSGGETQIPLYISLLAAFSQVYRVHHARRNNTVRLIIMDEAFNKIDGEKIKQCIQMIRSFGLQAIFSTPPEKISEIMAEADKALVVFRYQNRATLRAFSSLNELVGEPYEI